MARPIWSGTISFGLVNIPVKLFTAVREHDVHFHMLSKDGHCRLRRKLVCPETGEEFDFKNTTRGYEIGPDEYVVVTDKELEALKPEAGRTIEIRDFVELSEIDPIYYERPYWLVPDENGRHGYRLLFEALSRSRKVGIAKLVMRSKEYLAALRPSEQVICLETMRFHDEIVPAEEVAGNFGKGKLNEREVEAAERLVEALVNPFQPEKYHDEYRERVEELLERKAEGKEIRPEPSAPREPTRLVNLMEALQKSIAAARDRETGPPVQERHHPARGRRKSAARRTTRKRTA